MILLLTCIKPKPTTTTSTSWLCPIYTYTYSYFHTLALLQLLLLNHSHPFFHSYFPFQFRLHQLLQLHIHLHLLLQLLLSHLHHCLLFCFLAFFFWGVIKLYLFNIFNVFFYSQTFSHLLLLLLLHLLPQPYFLISSFQPYNLLPVLSALQFYP